MKLLLEYDVTREEDLPFWRKKKKKKVLEWATKTEEQQAEAEAERSLNVRRDPLRKIVELGPEPKVKARTVSPSKLADGVLRGDPGLDAPDPIDAAGRLIATLKKKATAYGQTGVNPDTLETLKQALHHDASLEREARLKEMMSCTMTFADLVQSDKVSIQNFNDLIRATAMQGRVEDAMEIHNKMKMFGFEPDSDTYVSLMTGVTFSNPSVAPEFSRQCFLTMRQNLISATEKVYGAMMKAHVVGEDLTSAFALMRKMDDEGLKPNVVVYTTLIDGLVKANKLQIAWDTFYEMRTWKLIQPDEVLFTVMIKACAKNAESEKAVNMLDDMRMCGLYPTDVTYTELIHACAKRADMAHKAFEFYREMKVQDMPLTGHLSEWLLEACGSKGDIGHAYTVVQDMVAANIPLNRRMYTSLIQTFASAMRVPNVTDQEQMRNLRFAWQVVTDMRSRGVMPDTRTLNALVQVYAAAGFSRYAIEMLEQYEPLGCVPDAHTYRILLEMLGRDMKDVGRFFALWQHMVTHTNIRPAPELHHLALQVAMDSRSAQRTVSVMEDMLAAKVFPTVDLIDRLAKVGRTVLEIHQLVGQFIDLNKEVTYRRAKRETDLVKLQIEEQQLRLAPDGLTFETPTPEQESRKRYFDSMKKKGLSDRPYLPYEEWKARKAKGGKYYAERSDRKRVPLVGL